MRSLAVSILAPLLILLAQMGLPMAAAARETPCAEQTAQRGVGTINLRIDNDMFGARGQDQGYSNGFLVSWVSPNLLPYGEDPCLPRIVQRLNRRLAMAQPEGFDEQNITLGISQMIYTPTDGRRRDLIVNDRPYAGALMLSMGYNARRGNELRTSQLRVGIVGPAAQARTVQGLWHDIIGAKRFRGWNNQLRNEPVFQLIHERRRRAVRVETDRGWGSDLTGHLGASLGNFATYANMGVEWRFGYHLPDDFGTAPLRPAGENTSPLHSPATNALNGHLFAALDTRWVLRDITLDGNTFRYSHSVHKRPLVADFGYGFAVYQGHWRLAVARYHRTREFAGQKEVPVCGTVAIGRRF